MAVMADKAQMALKGLTGKMARKMGGRLRRAAKKDTAQIHQMEAMDAKVDMAAMEEMAEAAREEQFIVVENRPE